MRPPLSWADLPGRPVGILGLGREGEASLRACRARGIEPVLVDDAPRAEGVLATAEGGLDALLACDVVIKTPGLSHYAPSVQELIGAGVRVVGGLGMWLAGADLRRVLCVTGTKGKSTTTAIAGHLVSGLGHRVLTGGNIGVAPFDPAVGDDYDYWVIEVSSYQAVDVEVSPPVVAVTSLHPDHLPWHRGDAAVYYRDKLSLCTRPGADLTVANGDSDLVTGYRDLLGPRVRWVHAEPGASWTEPLHLLGRHNRRNALIAGVSFVDDNLSTNVLPTLAAVEAFPDRRVALIVGGQDRGIDYRTLGEGLRTRTTPLHVLTVPDNGPHIREMLQSADPGPAVTATDTLDLASAVRTGWEWAGPGGVVLLSPAAPSFGRFTDYRQRGAAFAAAMETCRRADVL